MGMVDNITTRWDPDQGSNLIQTYRHLRRQAHFCSAKNGDFKNIWVSLVRVSEPGAIATGFLYR